MVAKQQIVVAGKSHSSRKKCVFHTDEYGRITIRWGEGSTVLVICNQNVNILFMHNCVLSPFHHHFFWCSLFQGECQA